MPTPPTLTSESNAWRKAGLAVTGGKIGLGGEADALCCNKSCGSFEVPGAVAVTLGRRWARVEKGMS
ncbi:MAG: hypothetical protein AMXMBFR33_32270 [Candidatus Xenobia bacterium]